MTEKQHTFILNLAQAQGITRQDLDQISVNAFGNPAAALTKAQASSLIEMLRAPQNTQPQPRPQHRHHAAHQ